MYMSLNQAFTSVILKTMNLTIGFWSKHNLKVIPCALSGDTARFLSCRRGGGHRAAGKENQSSRSNEQPAREGLTHKTGGKFIVS